MGDFWKSTDAGATWTSVRQAGGLPTTVTGNRVTDVGRINFAAGPTTDPTTTVLYAQASAAQETTVLSHLNVAAFFPFLSRPTILSSLVAA